MAFEHRNYTKAVEIVKFHARLRSSRQRMVCESGLLEAGLRVSLKDPKSFLKHYMVSLGCNLTSCSAADSRLAQVL